MSLKKEPQKTTWANKMTKDKFLALVGTREQILLLLGLAASPENVENIDNVAGGDKAPVATRGTAT